MFDCEQDEVFYKTLHQSSSSNFHDVHFSTRSILLVLTLDGNIYCFYYKDDVDVICNVVNVARTLSHYDHPPNVDVISSSVLSKCESWFLLICSLVNGDCKLLLYQLSSDLLYPLHYKQSIDVDYHPCFAKLINFLDESFFVLSGADESIHSYRLEENGLCQFFIGETLPPLASKIEAVVICIDFFVADDRDRYWFAVGCDSGLVVVWQVVKSSSSVMLELRRKFDTPVSILRFYKHNSTDAPLLCVSSALGPACLCSHLNEGNLTECLKFPKSDKYDVIITDFIVCDDPIGNSDVVHVAFGTFGYKLLLYSVNVADKTTSLKYVKDYLSPVIGVKKFGCFYVVLTCTGIYFYKM